MFPGDWIAKVFKIKPERRDKTSRSTFFIFIKDYLTYNKQERNGILLILVLILVISALTFSYRLHESRTVQDTSSFQNEINEFLASATPEVKYESTQNILESEMTAPSEAPAELFVFDPNTATEEDFIRLGLTQKQAGAIINYRNKGGKFRKKEDFAKMYTVSKEMYERLEAFIVLPEIQKEEKTFAEKKTWPEKKDYQARETVVVELNSADSLQLIKVRGIGAYTAMKIIELREKLGGFYKKEQVMEVYRLDSARYTEIEPFLTVDPFEIKKININTATVEELKNHPYIRWNIANSLINIRQQHGAFKSIDEIKKSHLVTEDVFRKIAPYLTIE